MKQNYSTVTKLKLFYAVCICLLGNAISRGQITQTYSYTGGVQTFTVPSCVSTISVEVWGAEGGYGYFGGSIPAGLGGKGGYAYGLLTVTQGAVLNIYVGGAGVNGNIGIGGTGGYNGGGLGGSYANIYSGGGGGGASDIRVGGTTLTNRIIVGAGGGGGSSYAVATGGDGGGLTGGSGLSYGAVISAKSGLGATQTAGGANGTDTQAGSLIGSPGVLGIGGASGVGGCSGGGGGGYYGGGGGSGCNGGGGGGGSSYFGGVTNGSTTSGLRSGNGLITFTYNFSGAGLIASASSLSICSGATPTLTASNVLSYTWNPGGSNATSITVNPTSNTSYTVRGTNALGCISTAVFNMTVDPGIPTLTVVNTANSGGICPSKTVALTASGATTYTWTGGSPTVTNGVVFAPTSTSGYTVNGSNACGTSSAATSISIHPTPTVTAVASTASLCSGLNLTLTGVGNSTAYAWSGGALPITNGVGFPPTTTATYTVIGTSALSCTALATVPVTVVTTPSNFPSQNTGIVCIGGSSTLTATGATNYTWTSATQTVFTSSFVVTPNIGTTTYTVTKSNANCFDTKTISVVTNSLPTIFAIVTPTLVCALNPANLAVGGGQSYTWTAPGSPNFTFTGASPVVSPAAPSTYTVAAFDGTCVNVATVFLNVNPNPTITASASSPSICNGQSVTLTGLGGINYTWTAVTLTANLIGATVVDSPTTATAYNVTGDNIFGCTSGATAIVLVNPRPIISAAASKPTVCSGGPTTLSASASGVSANSYTWDANANGALTYSTIVNPTSPVTTTFIYTVQGHNSFPCTSSQTVQVNVFVPVLTVSGNTNTCVGGVVHLSASGGNLGSYSWLTSIGGTPYTFQQLNATVNAPGIYTVNAVVSSPIVCPATQTVAVGVYFNPTITAVPQRTTICNKESVDLYGGGGATYLWSNGTPGGTITVNPTGNTTYTVTGTDANGCVGTGTVLVKVSGCSGINELNTANSGLVLYPNPNNGEFTIQANTELTLTLVNELGQTIRSIVLSGSNNYKVSVNDLAKGIYFIKGQKDATQFNQKVVVVK